MAFIPALKSLLVQTNYLRKQIESPLLANLGFDKLAETIPIEAHNGASMTLTRAGMLPPITQDVIPSQSISTDVNNGITPQAVPYEQFQTVLAKRRGMLELNLEFDQEKIVSEFLSNRVRLMRQAAESRDIRAAQYLFNAYDGGNTFAIAPGTVTGLTTAVRVDNIQGFLTSYAANLAAGMAAGVPTAVAPTNPLALTITNAGTGVTQAAMVVGATVDGTNVSTALVGGVNGIAYGTSGVVTLVNAVNDGAAPTVGANDALVAVDGSRVIRPNGKLTRAALAGTDLATLQILNQAKSKLQSRNVPKLPNGLYACMIDPLLWADLTQDTAFQRATAGQWGTKTSYFESGQTNAALGLEFVETSLNPVYAIPGQTQIVARHALVCGMGCVVKAPSIGFVRAAEAAQGQNVDSIKLSSGASMVEIIDGVKMTTRAPWDPEATVVTQTWSFMMGHAAATDVTSTPASVPTSDYCRYKRAVMVEFASMS